MSWCEPRYRYYVCSICGDHGAPSSHLPMALPEGWIGSNRKNGECICRNCITAIKQLKKKQKNDESSWR